MAFTTVTGSNGVTSLVGTSGIDAATIVTLASNVFVGAQGADDVITVALGTGGNVVTGYSVKGGAGSDTITFNSSVLNSTINGDGGTGTAGNDTLNFTANVINSAVSAGSGNDVITNGPAGFVALSNATVNGNAGNDTIRVGVSSASFVYGGQDTDLITTGGNASSVLINGNKGSDTITLGAFGFATSTVYGGQGNDTISAAAITDAAGAAISATASGTTLFGDFGNDSLTGSTGIDTIDGGEGGDTVVAGTGADIIAGGAGDDSIIGNAGADVITGGAGSDIFNYAVGTDASVNGNTGFDTISDFAANTSTTATPNGDIFNIGGIWTGAVDVAAATTSADAATLAAILALRFAGAGFAVGDVGVITISAGATNAGIAGNYLVVNNAGAGYQADTDAVIKLNTLDGITATSTNLFI